MSDRDRHSDEDRRAEDERLTRYWAEIDAAELRDAVRDYREQEKELADTAAEPEVISAPGSAPACGRSAS